MSGLGSGLLQTVIFGANTMSVVNKIGVDVLISTATATTASIGKLTTYILTTDQQGVDNIKKGLEDIDLEFLIEVLDQLIKEQEGTYATESVKKAMVGVHKSMEEINKELKVIKESMEYHQSKYFASWRGFDCSYSIETIKKHKNVLYKRYKILTNLLKIYNTNSNIAKK